MENEEWLSDQTTADPSREKSTWTSGQPGGTSSRQKVNCATIYGKYMISLGWFDDMSCRSPVEYAMHICESAVPCTKYETGRSLSVE